MNQKNILHEYHKIVGFDSKNARQLIKKLDYKNDHYLLQCIAQTYLDECRFNNNGTQRLNFDKKKGMLAEKYIMRAYEINPNCPDVLWVFAKVRETTQQFNLAILYYKKIINLGIKNIVYAGCKLELKIAEELINDSKFELYRLYFNLNPVISRKYLSLYKKGLRHGVHTIYKPLAKYLIIPSSTFKL